MINITKYYTNHIRLQSLSDFWLVLGVPVVQGVHVDPRQLEIEVRKILSACLPEILTPRTPGVSLETKFFEFKIFLISSSNNVILFILMICFSKKYEIQEKHDVLSYFHINDKIWQKRSVFLENGHFLKPNQENA